MVSIRTPVEIAQISKNRPHTVFGDLKSMFMGRWDSKKINRILFKSPIDVIPEGVKIMKANLKIYVQYVGNSRASEFIPYAVGQDWSIQTVNWINQPTYFSHIKGQGIKITSAGFYSFNITHLVEKWYKGDIGNFGIVLRNDEITNNTDIRVSTIINSSLAPVVEIFYAQESKYQCICKDITFKEKVEEIETGPDYQFSPTINTAKTKDVSFFLRNIGEKDLRVKIQISPDDVNYIDNPGDIILKPNEMEVFIPTYFTKYLRVAAKNINNNETSILKIWYQSQQWL